MGCWNKTCGITQMPIFEGEEIVTFVILSNQLKNTFPVYITDIWDICYIPFFGVYDDMGGQTDHDGQQPKYDYLRTVYKEPFQLTDTTSYDRYPNCKHPFDNNQSLIDSVHDSKFAFDNGRILVSTFVVLRSVYDKLTKHILHEAYPEDIIFEKSTGIKFLEDFNEYAEGFFERKYEKADIAEAMKEFYIAFGNSEVIYDNFLKDKGLSWHTPEAHLLRYYSTNNTRFSLYRAFKAGAVSLDDVFSVFTLTARMNSLRKTVYPQSGEGNSCGFEDDSHTLLIESMQEILANGTKPYDEDEAEQLTFDFNVI